jgi:Tol biopolymer transport system component
MTKRIYPLILLIIVATLLIACDVDEVEETPTVDIPVEPSATPAGYPGPSVDDGYPEPGSASGYPAPQQLPELPSVPLGEARFPGVVAFHSEQAGAGLQLYLFDGRDGSVTPLTGGVTQGYEPSWSQDCRSVIYVQQTGGDIVDLYTTNLDTNVALPFFDAAVNEILEWSPVWSPLGDRVAYQTNTDAKINICLADAAGLQFECLVRGAFDNADPAFSPDGNELIFVSNRDGDWEIYVTGADGRGDVRQLTNNNFADLNPEYSQDGSLIIFDSDAAATLDIYRMRADGSEVTRLTSLIENEREPEWIGSDLIVFSSNEDGDYDLYLMSADGEDLRQITDYVGKDGGAAWCPAE